MSIPDIQDALELFEGGRPGDALPLLVELAGHFPGYVAVHTLLARTHEALAQWPEAQTAWQQAAFLMPNSPAVQEGLARTMSHTSPPKADIEPQDRLIVDLDLQAELDAVLETAQHATFNPFALPPQTKGESTAPVQEETEAVEDKAAEEATVEDEEPMSLAEASLALVEAALDEAEAEKAATAQFDQEETAPLSTEPEEVATQPAERDTAPPEPADTRAIEEPEYEADQTVSEESTTLDVLPAFDEPEDAVQEAAEPVSIYDEIEQLIAQQQKHPPGETPQRTPRVDEATEDKTGASATPQGTTVVGAQPEPALPAVEEADVELSKAAPAETIPELEDTPEAGMEAERLAAVRKALALEQEALDDDTEEATPEEPLDDLERLISELESARLVPDPDLDDLPSPDLNDEIDDMVSETMARIYASQEHYEEAARVYDQLALQQPDQADKFNRKATEMRARAAGTDPELS